MNKNIFIFDLDGTLANIEHRRHLVTNGNHDWDKFYEECMNDLPNEAVIKVYQTLYLVAKYRMIIFSGRSEVVRSQTVKWLQDNGIFYDALIMRPDKDYTPDNVLKRKWLYEEVNKEEVIGIFDDREKVIKMWREEGLTAFQVAEGNF